MPAKVSAPCDAALFAGRASFYGAGVSLGGTHPTKGSANVRPEADAPGRRRPFTAH